LNDFDIRLASFTDLREISILEEDSFERPYPRFLIERLLHDCPKTFWVAADASQKIVGYCVASVAGKSAHLISIAVPKNLRRKGVGSILLQTLLSHLRKSEVEDVWLEVKAENKEAISLYTKTGFEKVTVIPKYYEDGSPALKMRLGLQRASPELSSGQRIVHPL